MSVKIRLRRTGATKRPSYRIVVTDSHAARDGGFIEIVGHYNPLVEPAQIVVKADRVHHWLEHGALPTEAAGKLLRRSGVLPAVPQRGAAAPGDARSAPAAE